MKKSRYKTNLSTVIYSGNRKGYPISANQSQREPKMECICTFLRIHSHFRRNHHHLIHAGKILDQLI